MLFLFLFLFLEVGTIAEEPKPLAQGVCRCGTADGVEFVLLPLILCFFKMMKKSFIRPLKF